MCSQQFSRGSGRAVRPLQVDLETLDVLSVTGGFG
jgi:hypothetical protein